MYLCHTVIFMHLQNSVHLLCNMEYWPLLETAYWIKWTIGVMFSLFVKYDWASSNSLSRRELLAVCSDAKEWNLHLIVLPVVQLYTAKSPLNPCTLCT